jgi:hypothetical protein
MIGTSFSRCVKSILDGEIDIDEVDYIIARTKAANPSDWEQVFETYMKICWNNNPEALSIASRLINTSRVIQPRLNKKPTPCGTKFWVKTLDEIEWSNYV